MSHAALAGLPTPTNLAAHPGRSLDRSVTVAVVGAGARGMAYAELVDRVATPARVVAVADPRAPVRAAVAEQHGIPQQRSFASWQELAALPRLADLAIVATQDHDHVGPAVALAGLGYDLLLEKPLAPDMDGVQAILDRRRADQPGVVIRQPEPLPTPGRTGRGGRTLHRLRGGA